MIVNLTPHAITIEGVGTIQPSGTVARVATIRTQLGDVQGMRITAQNPGMVQDLPRPAAGTIYIVSGMVLDAIKREAGPAGSSRAGRDVFAPDTGADAIRNDAGHIVAVRGLVA